MRRGSEGPREAPPPIFTPLSPKHKEHDEERRQLAGKREGIWGIEIPCDIGLHCGKFTALHC